MGEYEEQRRRRIEENQKRLHELLPPGVIAAVGVQVDDKSRALPDEEQGGRRTRRRRQQQHDQRLELRSDGEGELGRRRSARLAGHAGPSFEESQDMLVEAVGFEEERVYDDRRRKPRARASMHSDDGTKALTKNVWVGIVLFFFFLFFVSSSLVLRCY